jgi:hypothetical protein
MLDYGARLTAAALANPEMTESRESTPIACVTEGLLAYARLLDTAGNTEAAAAAIARAGMLLGRQLRFFHPSGAFVASVERPEVRIDYITHNLLGFMGYARLAT